MKIKPLFNRVLVKAIKEDTPSTSGIILPESDNEKSIISVVEEIGTGGLLDGNEIEWQVKKGNRVIFNKYSAHEFVIDNETFIIINQEDILGIIEE